MVTIFLRDGSVKLKLSLAMKVRAASYVGNKVSWIFLRRKGGEDLEFSSKQIIVSARQLFRILFREKEKI